MSQGQSGQEPGTQAEHGSAGPPAQGGDSGTGFDRDSIVMAFGDSVVPQLKGVARAIYSGGRFVAVADGVAVFALDNAPTVQRAEKYRASVEELLAAALGGQVPIRLVTEGDADSYASGNEASATPAESARSTRSAGPGPGTGAPTDRPPQQGAGQGGPRGEGRDGAAPGAGDRGQRTNRGPTSERGAVGASGAVRSAAAGTVDRESHGAGPADSAAADRAPTDVGVLQADRDMADRDMADQGMADHDIAERGTAGSVVAERVVADLTEDEEEAELVARVDELEDADVSTRGVDKLTEAFPGAELIETEGNPS